MAEDGQKAVYRSGQWEADLNRRELRAQGALVPLGGRAFDVIEALIRAGGDLVTKDALMAAVWPGAVVEENTIQVHISALRKALGRDRDMLRTTSGRGYRMLGGWAVRPENATAGVDFARPTTPIRQPRTNLPIPGGTLVGRDAAVRHLLDLLSAYRSVTLTGPGGIGKTRLSLEVARRELPGFDGDVWFVELVPLVDPKLVPSAVSTALGLEVRGNVVSPETVARAIGDRRLLLVLDNCEHVIDAAADLAETLLRLCPRITLLATSQEVLKIDGEYTYRLWPLEVLGSATADLLHSSAVQLFLARSRALGLDTVPDGDALRLIGAICRRLDGIPLAIEFAAARAATLGLEQVLARLDDRFALLTGGHRTALPRHQTLRATLDWSYELLLESERQLLRRLAVFAGGFTVPAAAAVFSGLGSPGLGNPGLGNPGLGNPESAAMDGIASLVSKSLVGLEGSGQVSRWRLLETTRAYALEKLAAAGEAAQTARRHAEFFRTLLTPPAGVTESQSAVDRLATDAREIDNIRAALDWAFSPAGDAGVAVALTVGAIPLWVKLSLMGECRGRVESALAILGRDNGDDPRARMRLSAALGWSLMFAVGRARETSAAWTTTLQLAEQLGDTGYRLRALWGLWVDDLNNGQFRKAAELAQQFAALVAGSTDAIDRMMADRMTATSLHFLGDQRNARRHIELMLSHYEMPPLDPQILRFQFDQRVTAHYFQARILWLQGFADQAMGVVERNVQEARSVGNALSLASVLGQGACPIALFTGDLTAAAQHGAALLDHAERHALGLWQSWARAFIGATLVRQGSIADGLRMLRAALAQVGQGSVLPRYLILIAELAAALGLGGETALGLETVDAALARCAAGEEGWYVPELLRIRGELLLRATGADAAAIAAGHFQQSIDRAQQQGALSWQLRSAVSLARLQQDQGHAAKARQQLSAVLGGFTEGFATADLQAAKQLLAELT